MSTILLNKIYLDIKDKVKSIFKKKFLFNIINDENNNIEKK